MNPITDLLLNPEEAAQLRRSENLFVHVEEAKEFINACGDPVDREILWTAFATLSFQMAPAELVGTFDVLFFVRVVAEMLKDREHFMRLFSSNPTNGEAE